jgi:hypothetical protein
MAERGHTAATQAHRHRGARARAVRAAAAVTPPRLEPRTFHETTNEPGHEERPVRLSKYYNESLRVRGSSCCEQRPYSYRHRLDTGTNSCTIDRASGFGGIGFYIGHCYILHVALGEGSHLPPRRRLTACEKVESATPLSVAIELSASRMKKRCAERAPLGAYHKEGWRSQWRTSRRPTTQWPTTRRPS